MNIPNVFDPLGSRVIELPYIQPIMTSSTAFDKSRPYSFLFAPEWGGNFHRGEAWNALTDRNSYWGTYLSRQSYLLLRFERPIKMLGFHYDMEVGKGWGNHRGVLSVSDDDEVWEDIQAWTTDAIIPTDDEYTTQGPIISISNSRYSKTYKFTITSNPLFAGIVRLRFDALYRG